eukprot:15483604-Alexandrium_andersonii.AAC.1
MRLRSKPRPRAERSSQKPGTAKSWRPRQQGAALGAPCFVRRARLRPQPRSVRSVGCWLHAQF